MQMHKALRSFAAMVGRFLISFADPKPRQIRNGSAVVNNAELDAISDRKSAEDFVLDLSRNQLIELAVELDFSSAEMDRLGAEGSLQQEVIDFVDELPDEDYETLVAIFSEDGDGDRLQRS